MLNVPSSTSFTFRIAFRDTCMLPGSPEIWYQHLPLRRIFVYFTPTSAETRHSPVPTRPWQYVLGDCPSWGRFDGAFDRGGLYPVDCTAPRFKFPATSPNFPDGMTCHGWSFRLPSSPGILLEWICTFEVKIPHAVFQATTNYTQLFRIEAGVQFGYLHPHLCLPPYNIRAEPTLVELKLS